MSRYSDSASWPEKYRGAIPMSISVAVLVLQLSPPDQLQNAGPIRLKPLSASWLKYVSSGGMIV
jgi:hypothetical protein